MKFSPRLSCPSRDNKYYNSNINPFVSAGYGMFQNNGNCTAYAYGRFMEEANWGSCRLSTGNAEEWYPKTSDGYSRGQTPKLGAVICWEGVGSKAGHVAVVEQINSDGSILTSNSAWQGGLFYMKTLYPPYYYMGDLYKFQGFIYNPDIEDTPVPDLKERIKEFQAVLNRCYGTARIEEDGIFGPDTLRKSIVGLQAEFNSQLGANLEIDGIFGPKTKNACPNLKIGDSGPITYIVQSILMCREYSINNDSIYGQATANVVKQFQINNGLVVDGICGPNTFEKLFA